MKKSNENKSLIPYDKKTLKLNLKKNNYYNNKQRNSYSNLKNKNNFDSYTEIFKRRNRRRIISENNKINNMEPNNPQKKMKNKNKYFSNSNVMFSKKKNIIINKKYNSLGNSYNKNLSKEENLNDNIYKNNNINNKNNLNNLYYQKNLSNNSSEFNNDLKIQDNTLFINDKNNIEESKEKFNSIISISKDILKPGRNDKNNKKNKNNPFQEYKKNIKLEKYINESEYKCKINYLTNKSSFNILKNKEKNNKTINLNDKFKSKIQKLEQNINELNNKIKQYEKNIKEYNKKILEFQINEKKLNEIKEKQNQENEKIKEELKKYIDENNRLNQKNKELEKEKNEIKLQYKQNKKINENNEILNYKSNNELKLKYKEPTLIGLNNIGGNSIIYAVLQCLSQTDRLTNYFLNKYNNEKIINNNIAFNNKNDYQLSPAYFELIQNLWEINGTKSYLPQKFINTIKDMNQLLSIDESNDIKDFIIFIIEQLHRELRTTDSSYINNISDTNEELNQFDNNSTFIYCFKEFKQEYSIISDIFFGLKEIKNKCLNCKNNYEKGLINNYICYNYEMFNCLIFPLKEVYNMKNTSMYYNNYMSNYIQNNNNFVSLYDCFIYNQKNEIYNGDNQNYCNLCKQLCDFSYSSKIFISPNVLILIIINEKKNMNNIKLNFNESLDITEFVYSKNIPKLIYNLYGVISDISQNQSNSHFIASCKSPINNLWYRYNDSNVIPITNIQNDIFELGNPYILFYKKT